MTDLSASPNGFSAWIARIDRVWASIPIALIVIAIVAPDAVVPIAEKTVSALLSTAPYIAFAVAATAYLRASGAEGVVAGAFKGSVVRMVVVAAMVGGLSPFCSCEVIPFIAALLAMGAPLAAVMAFWLASPIMDPPMFAITAGALGLDFAVAKTFAAVGMGLIGGFGVMLLGRSALFADPLRTDGMMAKSGGCCDTAPKAESSCCGDPEENAFGKKPVWKFWKENARIAAFTETARDNALFLGKWLALAYLLEAVMIRWLPAELIATTVGGDGIGSILLAAVVGAPAYLNGYAAAPLAAGFIEQGMSPGAAMAFLLAGGVTCIPAAVAVWSLVKPRIFGAYIGFALIGSVVAGLSFAAWAG
ncbi:MAG: permease [Pikeienuella sp.]